MWLMLAFVPGMFDRFGYLIHLILREKDTNLPLPVPWPACELWQLDLLNGLSAFSVGFIFLLLPLFYFWATVSIIRTRPEDIARRTLFIAATWCWNLLHALCF